MRLPFAAKRKQAPKPLGELVSYLDYEHAVKRLASMMEAQGGSIGVVSAVGSARAVLAGTKPPSEQDQLVIASARQLADCGEEAEKAVVNLVLGRGPQKGVAMLILEVMGPSAVPTIAAGLSRRSAGSGRKWLLGALHHIGGPAALAAAQSVVDDSDESVANAARAVLDGKEVPGSEKLQLLHEGMTPDERVAAAMEITMWLMDEGFL